MESPPALRYPLLPSRSLQGAHLLAWLPDQFSRREVRYPEIRMVFADYRGFVGEWTFPFLSSALADAGGSSEQSDFDPTGTDFIIDLRS